MRVIVDREKKKRRHIVHEAVRILCLPSKPPRRVPMRSSLVLCALLSAASGLTLRPCGRPTSRRAMLAGSLCAVVLPSFAEDAPEPAAPAAPPQMYQNGLVAPELAPTPLAEPAEITRAARHRTEPRTEPRTELPSVQVVAHLSARTRGAGTLR